MLKSDVRIAIVGRGLIGGSLLLAARRAGYCAEAFDKGEVPRVEAADFVFVAVPPSALKGVVETLRPRLKAGAVVADMTGVKGFVYAAFRETARRDAFFFVGAHPMAGKEHAGFAHAAADLFQGASLILTPYPETPPAPLARLEEVAHRLGFATVVRTTPAHHDAMIAFTSQLCHLLSSAYVREPLAQEHAGYSAGSFRDLSRVGAPDPALWTELFLLNRAALLPVLERCQRRLEDFHRALAADDAAALHRMLEEGVRAKATLAP